METLFQKYINKTFKNHGIIITSNSPQTFTHKFADGRVFYLYLKYNKSLDNWVMDIYLQQNNTIIPQALNVILQCGLDLLSQYKHLNLGEFYVIPINAAEFVSPNYQTLNEKFYYEWRHL